MNSFFSKSTARAAMTLLVTLLCTLTALAEIKAKAVLSDDEKTLTFYYDEAWHGKYIFSMNSGSNLPGWYDCQNVTTVVFDDSFVNACPTTTYGWFSGLSSLTTITGLQNLNTSSVTNMSHMFEGRSAFSTFDLSKFVTSNVTDMSYMFSGCTGLTSLDLSKFVTSNVTDMNNMFSACNNLRDLNLGGFNTAKVTSMSQMFSACNKLYILDLSQFNTGKVTDMLGMFFGCIDLSFLDLRSFNTSEVTNMGGMFNACTSLKAILVGSTFTTGSVTNSSYMFGDCDQLVGGNGTAYDSQKVDKTYAIIDGGAGSPGYFTDGSGASAKVVLSADGKTLTFCYDNRTYTQSYALNSGTDAPDWLAHTSITTVVFDPSFQCARPTTTCKWFSGLTSLTLVLDLEYLNTSQVTDMSYMFENCSSLKSILKKSSFDTSHVTSSVGMFSGCTSLVGGNGTTYDSNQTDATYACLDGGPSSSNPGYFTDLSACTAKVVKSSDGKTLTFCFDASDHSGEGTVYSLNSGSDNPGWYNNSTITTVNFEPSFQYARPTTTCRWFYLLGSLSTINGIEYLNTSEVTNMIGMFEGCQSLTTLDVSNFNTVKVTKMTSMFQSCSGLTSLDLSSFNTSIVETMTYMFWDCNNLQTIEVSDKFTVDAVTNSDGMFGNCTSLKGGSGTSYDSNKVDKTYARIDGGTSNRGYFTEKLLAKAILSTDGKTLTFYYGPASQMPDGTCYDVNNASGVFGWLINKSITTVVFDATFQSVKPTTTAKWFRGLSNLTKITDIKNLNTSEVTDMSEMFCGCSSLTTLDLSGFNTSVAADMSGMFSGCSNLKTIFATDAFSVGSETVSINMFSGCTSLVGGSGTTCDGENNTNATYARIDGGTDAPGYFTDKSTYSMKVVMSSDGKTLTFYFDASDHHGEGTVYTDMIGSVTLGPEWRMNQTITTVIFDPTFLYARPSTCRNWFFGLNNLTSISGIEFLNTSEATDLSGMFKECSSLTALDLSGFNTAKVEDMSSMFYKCSSLTTLDLSGFNTAKVTYMGSMFNECSSLKTILASNTFTTRKVISSEDMFLDCNNLVGGNGTTPAYKNDFDETCYYGISYAHIDGGTSNPGLFTDIATFLTLSNSADNTFAITNNTGTKNVLLSGRTLYRDGYWNTLCLPFNASLTDDNSPLKGATAMSLNSASFDATTGTLTLGFTSVTGTLTAGTPYIIKWENTSSPIGNPVFWNVNVKGSTLNPVTKSDETNGNLITFTGTYDYQKFTDTDRSILFMGAENTLYYPTAGAEIGACRAYFQLADGLTAGDPTSVYNPIKAFVLNFDEDSESTSISTINADAPAADTWFTLDGRRLLEAPEQPGLYIRNGHKVLLK